MEGYFHVEEQSAIDRAFGSDPSRGGLGLDPHGSVQQQGDVTNTSAPIPRKRPVATPAGNAAGKPAGGNHAANASQLSSVSSISDSIGPTPGLGRGGNAAHPADQAGLQHQMQELRQQMAEGMNAATADPAQQAAMYQRMTGLMAELQSIMAQMVVPGGQPHSPSSAQPALGGYEDSGLRRNARPFEPMAQPHMAHGGGSFGGRGGYGAGGSVGRGGGLGGSVGAGGYGAGGYHMAAGNGANPGSTYPGAARGAGAQWGVPPRPAGCVLCFVEFKRGRMKRFESDVFIAPGNYIIVDGDRGEDCGLVVHTFQRLPDGSIGRTETLEGVNIDINKVKPETGRVRRVADETEVDRLHGDIATLERHALKTCRERVETMGLNMDVVDCEYQFDRKKITFFFDAPIAIDFRELTKDLFKHFGARIWLENINSKVKNVVPEGALSHADKLMYAERGLRAPKR